MRSIFERYNARWLEPEEVAKSFVPPPQFADIATPRHAVILGPRGSGKTTLLKMLTRQGLDLWTHPDAEKFRSAANFVGVFIGSDRAWEGQLAAVGGSELDERSRTVIATAAFTTHVLGALIEAAKYRLVDEARRLNLILTPKTEAEMVDTIARAWEVRPQVRSFLGLQRSLSERFVELGKLAGMLAFTPPDERDRVLTSSYLHTNYLLASVLGVQLFDEAAKILGMPVLKWALLFDELEIAPRRLRSELFRQMRSSDRRFIFKLALSPYNKDLEMELDPTAPRPGNDYDEVSLWYTHRVHAEVFSRHLWRQIASSRGITGSAEDVLGASFFETPDEEWVGQRTAYRDDSTIAKRLREFARDDEAFAMYLRENRIDLNKLSAITPDRRAATVRKVYPIAAFRALLLRQQDRIAEGAHQQMRKGLKKPPSEVYSGAAAMFAMLEGNPRWFIGVMGRVLDHARDGKKVRRIRQVDIVGKAMHRFRALLSSLPAGDPVDRDVNLLTLIDQIGKYFMRAVLGETFDPDPPGTFIVPSDLREDVLRVLDVCLDSGALVLIPDLDSAITTSSLKGKRLRLSYLLAPHFTLPLRLGRSISLTTIIRRSPGAQRTLAEVANGGRK